MAGEGGNVPELPEVQTIVEQLNQKILNKKIKRVEVLRQKNFKGDPQELVAKRFKKIKRIAKILVFEFEKEWPKILGHLKLTGQLIYKGKSPSFPSDSEGSAGKKKSPFDTEVLPNKYTRVIMEFEDGSQLFFNDLRAFGWLKLIKNENEYKKEMKGFEGVDPLTESFTLDYFIKILGNWGRPIKILLMEQNKISGIGNIYANEALFCAGIAPHHRGKDLVKDHPEKVNKLFNCIREVLQDGLKYKGSSGSDEAYRQIDGKKGRMQEHFKVYQKTNEPCPNHCGKKIKRMSLGGRGTFFCPRCQT